MDQPVPSHPLSGLRSVAWSGIVLLALALVLGTPLDAQAQQATLQEAKEEYQFAEYDKAIDLFSKVAQDPTAESQLRQQALRYLGRAYIAKNKRDEAREAIRKLLKLEPPMIELDPDVEPPPIMDIYYDVRKELAGYEVQKQDPGMQTLAVMDFTNNSIDQRERFNGLKKGLPAMMINFMNGGTDLKVIERERIQWLLDELKLQRQADVVDQSTAVRTGKLLGANAVVFGSYTVHDGRMMILARVVKVETGEVLLGDQVTGKPDEFFGLIEELSTKITRSINVELEQTQMGAEQTNSLDAMMAYSDGLNLMEDGKYRAAYEKFLQAVEYDSGFQRAKLKAESLKPMLVASADTGNDASSTQMNR